jgi:dihydroorotate dehydrogenase/Pyruvate/2-oxoacid:ferredoxin oxidoreductase delta subunit
MANDPDIAVQLGPLTLRNPFIVGSGPTTKTAEQIQAARDGGWAAASLKLTIDPEPYLCLPPRYRWLGKSRMHIFTAEKRLTPRDGLRLMEQAKRVAKELAVFANISYDGADAEGWTGLARRFEEAGADAIELNLCCPNMSYNVSTTGESTTKATGASLGSAVASLPAVVRAVTGSVRIPVIAKLTPEGGRIAEAALACLDAGAAAAGSTANRLGIPEIDVRDPMGSIYRLQENITLGCLSGPWIRPLGMRDTYEMRRLLGEGPFVIGSGGVSDLSSAVQQIMVGADAVWICTETLLRGFAWMAKLLEELRDYMMEMGWSRIADFRGLLLKNIKSAGELVIHDGHAVVNPALCSGCGKCWNIGHCTAITHPEGKTLVDEERCLGCSTCVDVCLREALSMTRT